MARKSKTSDSVLAKRRTQRSKNRGASDSADWAAINPENLVKLIAATTALGISITFGYTRDGGAFYISLYSDGDSERIYIRPTEEPDEQILELAIEFENL